MIGLQLDVDGPPVVIRGFPVWVCRGYYREPKDSWSRAKLAENRAGTLYLRARTEDSARAWCKSTANPLPSWRRVRFIAVRQATPRDLGMVLIGER